MLHPRLVLHRAAHAAAALLTSLALAACGGSQQPEAEFTADPATLPGPPGAAPLPAPGGSPEELPGVDTSELVLRERALWWKMVSQLYAPCSDQAVSIAQCVREARACAACAPAAQLIADKIHDGQAVTEVQTAYAARFGPDVKKVELADSPARGPEGAPVVIVVWSDYECPACGRAVPLLDAAVERNAPHVRLVHKLYPLKSHPHAEGAARAAFAAKTQGKYWEMEKLLFENQRALEQQDLLRYAHAIGLALDRFQADMQSDAAAKVIARDKEAADQAGLDGTPFILINGREFDMRLFSLQTDLDPWIATEVKLKGGGAQAAAGGAMSSGGTGSAP